jgi:hypothetical protein
VGLSDGSNVGLGTTRSDAEGNVEFSITPGADWPAGEVIAVAHGQASNVEVSTKFSIGGSAEDSSGSDAVITDPSSRTVHYQGSGYRAGERVSAWFQFPSELSTAAAHALPDVYADAAGNVTFDFGLEKDWEYGGYQIAAQGAESKHTTYIQFAYFGTLTGGEQYWASVGTATDGAWQGQYFDNVSLSGTPVLVRADPELDFDWGTGSPDSAVPADDFSVRWTTTRGIGSAGNYVVTATADDGIRVWVDGSLVIDEWYDHSATTYSATIHLGQGNHTITVEYYERTLDAVAIVTLAAE